ncbi:hypothetical protein J1N35_038369 [Gossypium stocksii]|uniref:Uncharacterized protein n=1 Tax=Gossypium stocksii TaxID=47602 RepID=A0A9D3ZMU0_9ROSI|nr:hypothetical protein J1N35_038369 [Gossypium stocksii]
MSLVVHKYIPNLSKLEPLHETNYRHWSQRLVIFFEQLKVDYILFNTPAIEQVENSTSVPTYPDATKAKFEKENKLVKGYMLSHMANNLFDLFVKDKFAKSI